MSIRHKTKFYNMKTNLTLDKIEKTRLGTEFAILTLTIKRLNVSSLIVKLRGGNHNLRIMSSHLVYEMKFILEWLDKNSVARTNEAEIILFSKEMLKANNKLKDTLTFNN